MLNPIQVLPGSKCQTKENGYLKLELLIVISISAIMILIGVLNSSNYLELLRLNQDCQALKQVIQATHQLALSNSIQTKLNFNPIQLEKHNGTIIRSLQLHKQTKLISAPTEITCHNSGVCSPASVTLQSQQHSCSIVLALRGRVRLKKAA